MRAKKRLRVLADEINCCNGTVVDIGADHGQLCKMLIDENRAKFAIATDVSKNSLQKTVELVKNNNLQNFIETRVGDGLEVVNPGEADVIVIAGMGGYEIIKILSSSNQNVYGKASIVLQPVQNAKELRLFLIENGFTIYKDFVVKDKNKFYNTIVTKFVNTNQELTNQQIEFGLTNFDLQSEDFKDYLKLSIERCEDVLASNRFNENARVKINMAKQILNNMQK